MGDGRKYRHYDEQFKEDAVRLVVEGGKSIAQASRDLGVGSSILQRWVQQYKGNPRGGSAGGGRLTAEQQELEELRRKLALAEEEREILKKALAVFSGRRS